ncbi:hypothetical protein NM688_g8090 [Phlebia brevispora]|uniref:Uncharacterized protein n=1 Tax=Phlebia brevispora TaxID=194682 RepID=A0ACC1RXG4_9APHY|nr:hypothetical protein NM688_g8090 [Phlebia brevispora]
MVSLKSIKAYIKKCRSMRNKKSLGSVMSEDGGLRLIPASESEKDLKGDISSPSPDKSSDLEAYFPQLLCDAYHHPDVLVVRCDLKMEAPRSSLQEMGVQRVFTNPIRANSSHSTIPFPVQVDSGLASPAPPPYSPPRESCSALPLPSTPIIQAVAKFPSTPDLTPPTPTTSRRANNVLRLIDFLVLSFAGAGSFGKIHLVEHRGTRLELALKSVPKDPEIERAIRREQRILHDLCGTRGVLELLASFHDEKNYYLVTPFYENGDLQDEIHRWSGCLPLELATFWAAEMLLGIQAIHDAGIVHRDIKPENILIDENGHAIIADFGLATSVVPEGAIFDPEGRHIPLSEACGTYEYIAPEEWMGKEYSFPVDIFAWAVTVFEMFVGRALWRRQEDDEYLDMAKRTVMGTLPQWLGRHTLPSEEVYMMLHDVLKSDGEHRPSIKELMTHPFFAGV